MKELGPEVRLVHGWGGAEGSTDGQPLRLYKLTMNRRIRRKLARLQRLGRLGMPTLRVHEPSEEDELSPAQYMEKMIRTRKWSRVRIFGLNRGRRVPNRGGVLTLGLAASCNAILTPE